MKIESSRTSTSQQPDLSKVLESLKLHLEPTILFALLPAALQLAAQLCLVAGKCRDECIRIQEHLVHQAPTVEYDIALERAAGELELLKRDLEDREESMWGFSLELRKFHLARVFSAPDVSTFNRERLMRTYFPELPSTATEQPLEEHSLTESIVKHAMLFVRAMPSSLAQTYRMYRDNMLDWDESSIASTRNGASYASILDSFGTSTIDKEEAVARKFVTTAEGIVDDIEEVKRIAALFAEAIKATLETKGAGAEDKLQSNKNRDQEIFTNSHDIDDIEDRPKTPNSTGLKFKSPSRSPSPERLAKLPRVTFSSQSLNRHRRGKSSMSVEMRDGTPSSSHSWHTPAPYRSSGLRNEKGKERERSVDDRSPLSQVAVSSTSLILKEISVDHQYTAFPAEDGVAEPELSRAGDSVRQGQIAAGVNSVDLDQNKGREEAGEFRSIDSIGLGRLSTMEAPLQPRQPLPTHPLNTTKYSSPLSSAAGTATKKPIHKPRSSLPPLTGPDFTSHRSHPQGSILDKSVLKPFPSSKLSKRGFDTSRR